MRRRVRPHRSHRGRLVAAAVAAVVLVGVAAESVPPGTPGHQLWTTVRQRRAGLCIQPAAPRPRRRWTRSWPPSRQVIQQANSEQAQAIATHNPSVMSDTATPAHYQQLVQINQNLVAQGVTGIQLTNICLGSDHDQRHDRHGHQL